MLYTRYTLAIAIFLLFAGFLSAQEKTIGEGNAPNVEVTTSSEEPAQVGMNTLSGTGLLPNMNAASRFLAHATLGPDYELIDTVSKQGFSNWLEDQLTMEPSMSIEEFMRDQGGDIIDSIVANGGDSSDYHVWLQHWHFAWWQYVMTSPDLVRARVALALSEIFVISEIPELGEYPLSLANYYDMLIDNALGNYRDLIGDVTRHPAMGVYLTHVNNPKSDTTENRFPDENYAREVMQLFTIGLYELNPDGTHVLDTAGNSIETYDNYDIAEFAKIFTGFTWAGATEFGEPSPADYDYTNPMAMWNDWHEPGYKYLLNGTTVQNRNPVDGLADVEDALDNLFNHPNVGPFIGRLLIQRLVTSNPSPDYIERVAMIFNDNGEGVRGDLAAVVRQIIMDPEARQCSEISNYYSGYLREPMLRYTNLARGFNAASNEGLFRNEMDYFREETGQRPLASPSVFNFFQPDYQPIGSVADAGLVAPEFQITNSRSTMGYANLVHNWTFRGEKYLMEHDRLFNGETYSYDDQHVRLDLSDEHLMSENGELGDLIERFNLILVNGNLSDYTRGIIYNTIAQIPEDQHELRTEMALFLIMLSPDYLILR